MNDGKRSIEINKNKKEGKIKMPTEGMKYIISEIWMKELKELIKEQLDCYEMYIKYSDGKIKELLEEAIESIEKIENKFNDMERLADKRDDSR